MPERIPLVGSLSNLSRNRGYANKIIDPKSVLWSRWGQGEWGSGGYIVETDYDSLAMGIKGDVLLATGGSALIVTGAYDDSSSQAPNPWIDYAYFNLDSSYQPKFYFKTGLSGGIANTAFIRSNEIIDAIGRHKVIRYVVMGVSYFHPTPLPAYSKTTTFMKSGPAIPTYMEDAPYTYTVDDKVNNYDVRTIVPIDSLNVGLLDNDGTFIAYAAHIGIEYGSSAIIDTVATGGEFTGSAYAASFGTVVLLFEGDNVYRINGVPDDLSVEVWDSGWDFGEGVTVGRGAIIDSSGLIYKWGCDSDGYIYQACLDGFGDFESEDCLLYSEKSESPKGLTADSELGNPIGPIGGRAILSDGTGLIIWSPMGPGSVNYAEIAGHMPYLYYVACGAIKVDPPCNAGHFTGYRQVFIGDHFYATAEYDIEGTNCPDNDKCKGIHGVIYENNIQCNLWGYQGANPPWVGS